MVQVTVEYAWQIYTLATINRFCAIFLDVPIKAELR